MPNITITISKGIGGGNGGGGGAITPTNPNTTTENKVAPAGEGESPELQAIKAAIVNSGKRALSNAINQYGNMTGNNIAQRNINNMVQLAGYIMAIKVGGVIGAIGVATDIALNVWNYNTEMAKANATSDLLFARSGNITRSGGRETND